MRQIVEFAYVRSLHDLNWSNVQDLLTWGDFFNIRSLVRVCCQFLIRTLNIRNCIGVLRLAHWYEFNDLAQEASLALRCRTFRRGKYCMFCVRFWLNFLFFQVARKSKEILSYSADEMETVLSFGTNWIIRWRQIEPGVSRNDRKRLQVRLQFFFLISNFFSNRLFHFQLNASDPSGPRAYHGCVLQDREFWVIGGFNGHNYFISVRKLSKFISIFLLLFLTFSYSRSRNEAVDRESANESSPLLSQCRTLQRTNLVRAFSSDFFNHLKMMIWISSEALISIP